MKLKHITLTIFITQLFIGCTELFQETKNYDIKIERDGVPFIANYNELENQFGEPYIGNFNKVESLYFEINSFDEYMKYKDKFGDMFVLPFKSKTNLYLLVKRIKLELRMLDFYFRDENATYVPGMYGTMVTNATESYYHYIIIGELDDFKNRIKRYDNMYLKIFDHYDDEEDYFGEIRSNEILFTKEEIINMLEAVGQSIND